MAAKKCPLCGGNVKNNYCDSCGYSLPDEEDISALYNYDPSDYPQEEPAIREITPEHITDEIYPNRPEPMEFKVREEEKKESPFVNPYAEQNNGVGNANANTHEANPYANNTPNQNGGQSPFAGTYANNNPPQNQNPYANGNFKPYTNPNSSSPGDFSECMKKYWWMLLIAFFAPIIGIILLVVLGNNFDKKFKNFIKVVAIVGFFLPP